MIFGCCKGEYGKWVYAVGISGFFDRISILDNLCVLVFIGIGVIGAVEYRVAGCAVEQHWSGVSGAG